MTEEAHYVRCPHCRRILFAAYPDLEGTVDIICPRCKTRYALFLQGEDSAFMPII